MADLPPLVIPDELVSKVPPEQAAHAADWALTFGRGDTNLAQRAKHNTDLGTYAQLVQDSMAAHQAQVLQNNAGARALYFKQQEMRRQQEVDAAKARIDTLKEQRASEIHPLKIATEIAREKATAALEKRRVQEDALKSLTAEHENQFFADRATFLTSNPSATQEQIDANDISLNGRYPHAMKSPSVKEIVEPATRSSLARQREAEKAQAITAQNATAAETATGLGMKPHQITSGGAVTYQAPGEAKSAAKTVKEDSFDQWEKDLKNAVGAHGGAGSATTPDNVPPGVWKAFEDRKAALLALPKYGGNGAPAAPATTEIIVKDGKRYEVNHETKAVTPL